MTFLIVATAVWVLFLSLIVLWFLTLQLETNVKFKLVDYGINLALYNDLVYALSFKEQLTTEEELKLVNLQDRLAKQANALGIQFAPFERPRGND